MSICIVGYNFTVVNLKCVENREAAGQVTVEKEIRTTESVSQTVADPGCCKPQKRTEKTEVPKVVYETLDEFPLSLQIPKKVENQKEGAIYSLKLILFFFYILVLMVWKGKMKKKSSRRKKKQFL
jgi:hypothetical protein